MSERGPAVILGGTGYVAGELLRLLASHPYFDLAAVASDSQPDEPVAQFFRHLQPVLPHLRGIAECRVAGYGDADSLAEMARRVLAGAPAQFAIGSTVVTWTVTDNSGNTATCQQTVTVVASGQGIAEAWENSLVQLIEQGCDISTQYDKPGDPPSLDCTMNATSMFAAIIW